MTGRIIIDLFCTLDGVAQAPGGPDEDTSDGFRYGGWQPPVFDEVVGGEISAGMERMDALLLGRRTYDIFASFWPRHTEGTDGEIGVLFNRLPKYVASRGTPDLKWEGTSQLGPDLAAEMSALRDRHAEVHVMGSIDLVQSLLRDELYDELVLWVHPVVLGQGKKVFPDGATPANLRLVEPPVTSPKGVVLLRYAPAGEPTTGSFG